MKKIVAIGLVAMLYAAMPAHAQLLRRPLVQKTLQNPVVNQLVDFGLQQVLPGLPSGLLSSLGSAVSGNANPATGSVDSSVKGNLDRSTKNFSDANDILTTLASKYKDAPNKTPDEKKDPPKTDSTPAPKTAAAPDVTADPSTSLDPLEAKIAEVLNGVQLKSTDPGIARQARQNLLDALQKSAKYQDSLKKGKKAMLDGVFDDAVAAFKDALQLNPNDENIVQNLLAATSEKRGADVLKSVKDLADKIPGAKAPESKGTTNVIKLTTSVKEVSLPKKNTVNVPVELSDAAPDNLTLEVTAKNIDVSIVKGTGTIAKGQKAGTLSIVTADVPRSVVEITVTVITPANTNIAPITIKTAVQAK